jgi:hypothetical protein
MDKSFWVTTGDDNPSGGGTERYVLRFIYDAINDTWEHEVIGSGGIEWKWSSLTFKKDKYYYCQDGTPGRIYMGYINEIRDQTKRILILDDLPNDPIGLFVGPRGDVLVTLSNYRTSGSSSSEYSADHDLRKLYYAKDGYNFEVIFSNTPNNYKYKRSVWNSWSGITNRGKLLATPFSPYQYTFRDIDRLWPSVFLDEVIRDAGYVGCFLS